MTDTYIFTSESVSEGHPDKIADQISDAVLDAILAEDRTARVACETMVKTGMVVVAGEITTDAWVDLEDLARRTILDIGYDSSDVGLTARPARYSTRSANNPRTSPSASIGKSSDPRAPATRA